MRCLTFSLILICALSTFSQTTSYDFYLGDPATKLYFSYKCVEAKKLIRRLEFGSPEAAEKAGYAEGECTLANTSSKAAELFDAVLKTQEGESTDLYLGQPDPSDTYERLPVAGKYSGKVVGITDGDTVTILSNGQEVKVRLAGIDAPEKGQAFGQAAKTHLSDLIFGKQVEIEATKKDGYGRTIGKIFLDGKDINLQMVADGYAWHYKTYAKEQSPVDRTLYADTHNAASNRRSGLWIDGNAVAPSVFRSSFAFSGVAHTSNGSSAGTSPGGSPGGVVHVRGYYRKNGTYVRPHTRSSPRRKRN